MTKKGCIALLGILTTAYPRYYANLDEIQLKETTALWAEMLSDIDDNVAAAAVKRLIATSKFPPSISEVRESVVRITDGETLTAGESWGHVRQAIRHYGYYQEREALEGFDEATRKSVEAMGWQKLCMSDIDNEMSDRAHYLRIYEAISHRAEQEKLLPNELKKQIAIIAKRLAIDGGERLIHELQNLSD